MNREELRALQAPLKDLDFRGTLGVSREAPVGFQAISLTIALDTDATPAEQAKLLSLTERCCVVFRTLTKGCPVAVVQARSDGAAHPA